RPLGAAEIARRVHRRLSKRCTPHARSRPCRRRTPLDRAQRLFQAIRAAAVGVRARLAAQSSERFPREPFGCLRIDRGERRKPRTHHQQPNSFTRRTQMTKQAELHVVSDGGTSRAATTPEMPGCVVAGAGEPIVLLHSSLSSKSQWSELAARL